MNTGKVCNRDVVYFGKNTKGEYWVGNMPTESIKNVENMIANGFMSGKLKMKTVKGAFHGYWAIEEDLVKYTEETLIILYDGARYDPKEAKAVNGKVFDSMDHFKKKVVTGEKYGIYVKTMDEHIVACNTMGFNPARWWAAYVKVRG